ncbi:MAG: hypothetical protein ACE5JL_02650 [Dehalococcoidia bacterium]
MAKPIMGIDLDGVICRPPFGLNLGIGRGPYKGSVEKDLPLVKTPSADSFGTSRVKALLKRLQYLGRGPMGDARAGLLAIKEHRNLVLITSRSGLVHGSVESWLSRHGMLELFEAVHTNNTGLSSPEFKWHMISEQGIEEFVDDDGRVADLLARMGLKRVYLRDWPRNRGYRYPDNVVRVASLREVSEQLAGVGG